MKVVTLIALAVVLLGVGVAYLVAHFRADGKVPARTSVNGVAVGGMDRDEARRTLTAEAGPAVDAPITVVDGRRKATLVPSDAGMTVDWDATLDRATGSNSWNPVAIWNTLRGGGPVKAVTTVDEDRLEASVKGLAKTFAVKPADATVTLDGVRIRTTEAVRGRELDVGPTTEAVRKVWPGTGNRRVEAVVKHQDPAVTDAKVDKLVNEVLTPTLSGPVVVDTGRGRFSVSREHLARATTITTKDGQISASTDAAELYELTSKARDDLGLDKARDARIVIEGGKPVVKGSREGAEVSKKDFVKAVTPALRASGKKRVVKVPVAVSKPSFTTADARKAGVTKVIGQFTTEFAHAAYHNTNLTLAANSINNTYLAPGDTFDLDEVLGPRTAARGYVDGWVISGASMKKESAGGVSQSATTAFNAGFFAGMTDVEHHPHSLYFSRYPAGREATLYSGSLNMRFRNDTKYGALVQAYTRKSTPGSKGSITVKVWSTPTWEKITSTEPKKSNFRDGRKIESKDKDCHPQSASKGFDVAYSRLFWRNGSVAKGENFSWRYQPTEQIVCK